LFQKEARQGGLNLTDKSNKINKILVPRVNRDVRNFKKLFEKTICTSCNKNCNKYNLEKEAVMVYAGILDRNYDTDFHRLMATHHIGELSFSVGKSMMPFLYEGDVLMLLPYKFFYPEDVKVGDIVGRIYRYYKGSKTIERGTFVHRITEIKDNKYLTKGDHNKTSDEWCSYGSIYSLLVGYMPKKNNYSGCTILRPDLITRWVGMGMKIRKEQEKKNRELFK
jgi:signal peptidase I